jgi:2-oxoglutarate ferredoxin oxidoreductase subunit beta
MKITKKSIKSPITPTWCPGCGNFGILRAFHSALEELELEHENVVIVYGVGCAPNEADFNRTYGIHSLHGREVPNAIGAKLANHDLKIIVVGGEGDLYGEGANHFLFAARGNHDITMLVHNNWRYSLTTGQASPTTPAGTVTKTSPEGLIEMPFNPLQIALSAHASFVAQGYASNYKQLKEIIKEAILHKGFSLVDIIQPCVTFNKVHDFKWYSEHLVELENHDASDWQKAYDLAADDREKIKTGIYYQNKDMPAYHEQIDQLQEKTLVEQWQNKVNLSSVIEDYA